MASKLGAEVTILYRRTRAEMPAIEREIDEALEEDVKIEYLAAPIEILRDDEGRSRRWWCSAWSSASRTTRTAAPVPDRGRHLRAAARDDDHGGQPEARPRGHELVGELGDGWLNGDDWGFTGVDGIWTGGDNIDLGIATTSIGQAARRRKRSTPTSKVRRSKRSTVAT